MMIADRTEPAFAVQGGSPQSGIVVLCDHASPAMPAEYGDLGLGAADLARHIAYDIGAEGVTRSLAARLGCPAVLSRFSRLLIDPNRGLDDPTLVMRVADGAIVPGNAKHGPQEKAARVRRFYRPYDEAVAQTIAAVAQAGRTQVILSIHSFTPVWRGRPRPWHIGILWDSDPRLPLPLLEALRREPDLVVGDNEPYDGALAGDTLDRHAGAAGYPNALVELRQDLIAAPEAAAAWGLRLAGLVEPLLLAPALARPMFHPSRARNRPAPRQEA